MTGIYIENLKESDPKEELEILLRAPLAALPALYAKHNQPVPTLKVLLIDSLDEAVVTTGNDNMANLLVALSQADGLPSWIRFVLTSRPDLRVLQQFESVKPYKLEELLAPNLTDIERYVQDRVQELVAQPELEFQTRLEQAQLATETLVHSVKDLSQGNFLYTRLLVDGIAAGQLSLKKSTLPRTLNEIYQRLLRNRCPFRKWIDRYQPILGTLTASQEPISREQLVKFVGRDSQQIQDALGVLQQFLDEVEDEQGQKVYEIFHQSLREFLLDKKNNQDFWCDTKEQHEEIINYYYRVGAESWGNGNWENTDKYGLLYLPKHLYSAEQKEELYTLLTGSPKWMEAKSNAFGNAAYVDDLNLAIDDFDDPLEDPNQLVTLVKLYTALQVTNQRVSIPNLRTLVWLGRKTEALSHARLMSDAKNKFDALLTIHNALKEQEQLDTSLLNEAEKIPEGILDNLAKAEALTQLATALVEVGFDDKAKNLFNEAEKVAGEIQDDYYKVKTLKSLAIALATAKDFTKAEEVTATAEKAVSKIKSYRYQAEVLGELGEVLAKIGCRTKAKYLFNEARKVVGKDEDSWRQAEVLIKLAVALARVESNETNSVFNKVEQVIDTIPEDWRRVDTLIKLASALAQTERKNEAKYILSKVTNVINTTDEEKGNLKAKLAVAQAHTENFSEAETVALTIQSKVTQVKVFSELAVIAHTKDENKATDYFIKAKKNADRTEDGLYKAVALSKLAEALEETKNFSQAKEIAIEAEKIARVIKESWNKAELLSKLATILARAECDDNKVSAVFSEAEKAARSQKEKLLRVEALSKLAVGLVQSGREAKPILTDLDEFIQEIIDPIKDTALIGNEIDVIGADFQKMQVLIQLAEALAQVERFSKLEEIANTIQDNNLKAEILSQLAAGLAKAKDFSKAEKVIQAIEQKSAKARAMSKLGAELAKNKDKEASNIFSKAKELALDIEEDNSGKSYILIELANELAHAGKFVEARKIINLIKEDCAKAIGLSRLATAYVLTKNFNEAKNVVQEAQNILITIKGGFERLDTSIELSIALAQLKLFKQAFSILKPKVTSYEFLMSLMKWQSAFEQLKIGITANILQESIHIFAWEHSDWCRIDKIFCSNTQLLLENQNEESYPKPEI